MPELSVNGVRLYYEEHGAGAAIVGLHGAGSSAALWEGAAPELARHGRTILYDRRGSFRSERPEPYATNVHEQADDAAALIDALGAAPAIVIARSYGGAIAVELALRSPDRVRALVLLEGDVPAVSAIAATEWADLERLLDTASRDDPARAAEALIEQVLGEGAWARLPARVQEILAGNGPALLAELRGGYPEVTAEQLATIEQPTLFVGARDSAFDYRETAEALGAAMPSVRVEWVDGGHAIDPADRVVLAFVDEVLASS